MGDLRAHFTCTFQSSDRGKSREQQWACPRSYHPIWPHWKPRPLTLVQGTACINSSLPSAQRPSRETQSWEELVQLGQEWAQSGPPWAEGRAAKELSLEPKGTPFSWGTARPPAPTKVFHGKDPGGSPAQTLAGWAGWGGGGGWVLNTLQGTCRISIATVYLYTFIYETRLLFSLN